MLLNRAGELWQHALQIGQRWLRGIVEFYHYASDIFGVAFAPQQECAAIALVLLLHIFDQSCRLADANHEHAGGEGIERASVAHFIRPGDAIDAIDHVARRPTDRFVDVEETEQGTINLDVSEVGGRYNPAMDEIGVFGICVPLLLAAGISLPVWLPMVFGSYAIGRRRFSLRLLLILIAMESVALAIVVWLLRSGGLFVPIY